MRPMATTTQASRRTAPRLRHTALALAALLGGSAWGQPVSTTGATVSSQTPVDPNAVMGTATSPHQNLGRGWTVQPALKTSVVLTDNVGYSTTAADADAVLVLTPSLSLQGRGGRYRVDGTLSFDGLTYLGRSRADRVLPQSRLNAQAEVAEKLFFVDLGASAVTTTADPFGALTDAVTSLNRTTVSTLRVSPYLDRELTDTTRLTLRTDHRWTRGYGNDTDRENNTAALQTQDLQLQVQPRPLGITLSANRDVTDYRYLPSNRMEFRAARVTPQYAFSPEFIVRVTGGRDEARYLGQDVDNTLRGGGLHWTPTERTVFDLQAEKRFFGNAWNVTLDHRSPFVAVNGTLERTVTTYAAQIGTLSAGSDTAALLDSLLTTRFPDATQRAAVVQELITNLGLPSSLSSAISLYSGTPQVVQGGTLSTVWSGVRHNLTVRYYARRVTDLQGSASTTQIVSADSSQRGGGVTLVRRLSRDAAAEAGFDLASVHGEGLNVGDDSLSRSWRVGLTHSLSPRTSVAVTLRYQTSDTTLNAATSTAASQTSLTLGALHRF